MKPILYPVCAATLILIGCGEGNQQSISVSGNTGGNISQSQSGSNNSQSISIGSTDGKVPSVNQSQTGSNRSQSLVIDGKQVESKSDGAPRTTYP